MRFSFSLLKIFFLSLLLIITSFPTIAVAGRWNFNGELSAGEDSSETSYLRQNYNLSYSVAPPLTYTIDLSGSLRYSRIMSDRSARGSSVSSSTDSVAASYFLRNDTDLYRLNFYNSFGWSKPSNGKKSDRWLWSVAFDSSWGRFLPPLRLTLSQNGARTDSVATAKEENLNLSTSLNYLEWLTVRYNLDWNREPRLRSTDSEFVDYTQGVNHGHSYSFFSDMLSVNYSLGWRQQQLKLSGGNAIAGIDAFQQKTWLRCPDNTPDDFDEPGTNIFVSGCTIVSLPEPTTIDSPYLHLEFETKDRPGEFLNIISLFVESEGGEELQAADYTWYLYRWNEDDMAWEERLTPVPVTVTPDTADPLGRRFRFDLDVGAEELSGDWFRLVLREVSPFSPEASITSIETNRLIVVSPGKETRETRENSQARLSLSMRPWKYTSLQYSVGYDRFRDPARRVSETLINGVGLGFSPSRYVSASFLFSDNLRKREGQPDKTSRDYALGLSSRPLDTLDIGISTSLRDQYTDSERDDRIVTYGLTADARLYADLDGNFNLSYSHDPDDRQSGSFSERIRLDATLRPSVTATLDQDYGRSTGSGATSHAINGTLRWRVSDALQLNGSLNARWATDEDMGLRFSLNMAVAPNCKNRGELGYSFTKEDSSHSLTGSWAWTINRILNFTTDGSYSTTQDNESFWRVAATLRFSVSL